MAGSLYNKALLPARSNPKGDQRHEIWQIDMFYFSEFEKLMYIIQLIPIRDSNGFLP